MTKKSKGRIAKDEAKKQALIDAKAAKVRPQAIDPMAELARAELSKIADQEHARQVADSEREEELALSGAGGDLWQTVEMAFQGCNTALVGLGLTAASMNDTNVHHFIVNKQNFTDLIRIFHADMQRFKEELEAIHDLHKHRLNDNAGPRETLAAMEIHEHYEAWRARALAIMDRSLQEAAAAYDEGRRRLNSAVERKLADRRAAEQAAPNEGRTQIHLDMGEATQEEASAVMEAIAAHPADMLEQARRNPQGFITQAYAEAMANPGVLGAPQMRTLENLATMEKFGNAMAEARLDPQGFMAKATSGNDLAASGMVTLDESTTAEGQPAYVATPFGRGLTEKDIVIAVDNDDKATQEKLSAAGYVPMDGAGGNDQSVTATIDTSTGETVAVNQE